MIDSRIRPPAAEEEETSNKNQFTIRPARNHSDLAGASHLFRSYALSLGIDLSFQAFETELHSLPGKYSPQTGGEILLAFRAGEPSSTPIGCVALRTLGGAEAGCCEMKRLYVSPEGRGLGMGEELAGGIIRVAAESGYRTMKLDTLPTMVGALALYEKLGFVETEPYYETPITGTVFLAKELQTVNRSQNPR